MTWRCPHCGIQLTVDAFPVHCVCGSVVDAAGRVIRGGRAVNKPTPCGKCPEAIADERAYRERKKSRNRD